MKRDLITFPGLNVYGQTVFGIAALMVCMHLPLLAQTKNIIGKVTYVSGDSYFTDVGKEKGAAIGDTLYAKNNKAVLVIQSISKKSSFCLSVSLSLRIDLGMEIHREARKPILPVAADSLSQKDTVARNIDTKSLWSGAALITEKDSVSHRQTATPKRKTANQVVGRIAFQNYISKDRLNSKNNFQQPGGVINFGVNRIGGGYYNFNSNVRYRKTFSKASSSSVNYPVRVYELSVDYRNPASPVHYAFGRIFSPAINGIGNFDGGLMSVKTSTQWEFGTFGGKEPNYENSKPDMANSKLGVYVNYKRESSPSQRWSSTVAFSGQYVHNKIDREYIYVQNDVSFSSDFYVYMNSEIGINRSKLSPDKKLFDLSNLYVMTRFKPLSAVTLSLSYDERVNVYLIQTYTKNKIVDSLFDNAMRRGFRGDVSWRMTKQISLSASSSIRTRAGDPNKTYLSSAGLYYYNVLQSRFNLNGNYFLTSGRYTKANSASAGVSRQFYDLYLSAAFRTYRYRYTNQSSTGHYNSILGDASYSLSRHLYTTLEIEHLAGQNERSDRLFVELSYRF